jgi:hypothetical protein
MADRLLHISWGAAIAGREERGLEVFNEAVILNGRMYQEGRIENFEVAILGAGSGPNGYMDLYGTAEQLAAVQEADDFRTVIMDAALTCYDLCVTPGVCNEGVVREVERYQAAISRVPQTA